MRLVALNIVSKFDAPNDNISDSLRFFCKWLCYNHKKLTKNLMRSLRNLSFEADTRKNKDKIEMNKKLVLGIIIFISIILGIYGFIVLPETVTVQIDISGNQTNTFPKILAVMLPLLLSVSGGLGYYFLKEKEKKYLMLSFVGILLSIITLVFNI